MRRQGKLILILFSIFVIAVTTEMATRRGQSQDTEQGRADKYRSQVKQRIERLNRELPIADAADPDPTDPFERAKRAAKGKKYSRYEGITDPPGVVRDAFEHWPSGFPALPIHQSDAVIIGQITKAKAYLTNNKTTVYSQFSISVERILKDDNRSPLMVGGVIITERPGGRVRYPSGYISRFAVVGRYMPLIGHRYVLFLKRDAQADDYELLTAYELREGRVFPLDESPGEVHFEVYANTDETAFLNELQSAMANSSQKLPQ